MGNRPGRDWKPAAAVLVVVAALIAVPALLAAAVPTRETTVPADTEITLTAAGEAPDTIGFAGVAGWSRRPTGDRTTAVLDAPGDRVLLVTVVNGVTDPDAALSWRRKVLELQTFPVVFDGGTISTAHGFTGATCRGQDRAGVCAIVVDRNLVVSLMLSGDAAAADLSPIVHSLRVLP